MYTRLWLTVKKTTKISHFSAKQFSKGGLDCYLLSLTAVNIIQRMLDFTFFNLSDVAGLHT